jgi:ubiquinone/menaquinone biosynthesis C-methylase UbiE
MPQDAVRPTPQQSRTVAAAPVLDAIMAYQRTAAMRAAIDLDLFTLIGSGIADTATLGRAAGASERGVRILCDALCAMGLLAKSQARYTLTHQASTFLDMASPAAINESIDFLAAPEIVSMMLADPAAYVRDGGAEGLASVAADHPIWVRFARGMIPIARPTAKRVAALVASRSPQPRQVLDVAAGHGLYGIEIARVVPGAVVTAIDWPSVLELGKANAAAAGVEQRHRALVGDAFGLDWGGGFDLVVMGNLLHIYGRDDCLRLLRKARGALASGGAVWIVEFVPDEDRISPPIPAMFAFFMLGITPKGDAYIGSEIEAMGRESGFRRVAARALPPTAQTLFIFEA